MAGEGNGAPCWYCGGKINNLAARPSLWGIPLCHEDEPGVVKWHHEGCVSKRLRERDMLIREIEKLENGKELVQSLLRKEGKNA